MDTRFPQTELGEEFSVECWVKPADAQSMHADIFGNHVSEGLGFVLQQNGRTTNQFLGAFGAGESKWVTTDATPLAAGRWQHVALVKTHDGLQLYLNGVLVAAADDSSPCGLSPMPVAVGLGYTDQERCFRGLIDEFRIWNKALDRFRACRDRPGACGGKRGPMPSDDASPRPPRPCESWTLADRRHAFVAWRDGRGRAGRWRSFPARRRVGIGSLIRVAFGFLSQAEVAGQSKTLAWRFVDAAVEESDGRKLTLRFACDEPALEIASQWHARPGPGPVHHAMHVRNRRQPIGDRSGSKPTFDLDLTGGATTHVVFSQRRRPAGSGGRVPSSAVGRAGGSTRTRCGGSQWRFHSRTRCSSRTRDTASTSGWSGAFAGSRR